MEEPAQKLQPREFLERSKFVPVIDVRAPKEFRQGHIPGAISLPLFDDEERALVGTSFTRVGRKTAILKGLEIAGPKLKGFTEKALALSTEGELLVHCWRGGMRSEAMAWLFTFAGIKTSILEGGYKAYRKFIRESFTQGPSLLILGGMTGSGKTDILRHLSEQGEQIIDLEGLAHHKGSAFGALGQEDQPTGEQFENDLAAQWLAFDPDKPVWVEDESRSIGKVLIPEAFYLKMIASGLIFVEVPFETRVKRLAEEYGSYDPSELTILIRKLNDRLGGARTNEAVSALENANLTEAIALVLNYYDKAYRYGLSKREESKILKINLESFDLPSATRQLIQHSTFNIQP